MHQRRRILCAVFCLGFLSTLAQVVFTREMLVAFYGNELCIGTILAGWLVCVGAGSWFARVAFRRPGASARLSGILGGTLALMALLLPLQVVAMRIVRLLWRVPAGEYASFGALLAGVGLTFLPFCFGAGLFFPLACRARAESGSDRENAASPVSWIYTIESAGSMAGGIALTFVLLPLLTASQIVLLGSVAGLTGGAFILGRSRSAAAVGLAAVLVMASVASRAPWIEAIERGFTALRWRAFGVIGQGAGGAATRLVAARDTVYQNLAVTESAGQFTLYGNGQVMCVFPDPIGYEHSIHFIMAQRPDAQRVLLLGGNPVGDIPELLKYPLKELVYVELDPATPELIRQAAPEDCDRIMGDSRVRRVAEDGVRFVRQCREPFDVVLVNAPEPTTAAANRYYTVEFYRNIRRFLPEDGFLFTAVTSSERLQSDAANLGATVYRTLKEVFPVVLVTAESRNRFFAGTRMAESRQREGAERPGWAGLTFDPATLAARSRSSGVETRFFRPDYFLGADEIEAAKVALAEERFEAAKVPLNTDLRPVSYFYNLLIWARYSSAPLRRMLDTAGSLRTWALATTLGGVGAACLVVGWLLRRRGSAWSRCMLGALLATTGFCGMALEMLLILVFQSLHGYVYTRIGLIVAAFMLGLVFGAPAGRALAGGSRRRAWWNLASVESVLLLCAAALPGILGLWSSAAGAGRSELGILFMVGLVGWTVGAEFPLANQLFVEAGGSVGTAAAMTHVSDSIGAAAGSLLVGVVLAPVLGVTATCVVLAAVKGTGLLLLASAATAMPARG